MYTSHQSLLSSRYSLCMLLTTDLLSFTAPLQTTEVRRRLLEQYARENYFNPHNPENWYKQRKSKILEFKVSSNYCVCPFFVVPFPLTLYELMI